MLCRLGRCLCVVLVALGVASVEAPPAQSQAPKAKDAPAKSLVVKHVTLQGKDVPLSKALQVVKEQTGIEVRRGTDDDPLCRELKLDKTPFWQALDEIASAADVRLSLYQRDGKPAMVAGPYREVPVCYSGPFRISLKRLVAIRDFETNGHGILAKLEVAWQPPFQPFMLETMPDTFALKDDKMLDQELPPLAKSAGYISTGQQAFEFDVTLPALRRDVKRIGAFKGELKMVGSASTLTFDFPKLAAAKLEKDGVTVEVLKVAEKQVQDDPVYTLFTADLRLKYPPSAIKESHQIAEFLVRSRAQLAKGDRRLAPGGDFGFDPENGVMTYRWEGKPEEMGKPGQWKLEYTAPGPVIEVPIQFEFKDVLLP